jgi:hypothetical protein
MRTALSLPREPLLNSRFVRDCRFIAAALRDLDGIGELIQLWEKSLPPNVSDHSIVLAVDAIAFHLVVTIQRREKFGG